LAKVIIRVTALPVNRREPGPAEISRAALPRLRSTKRDRLRAMIIEDLEALRAVALGVTDPVLA
jgi:hypothetical protein